MTLLVLHRAKFCWMWHMAPLRAELVSDFRESVPVSTTNESKCLFMLFCRRWLVFVFHHLFLRARCVSRGCCPGITFLHEGVAYDTSSGLGQTSPDPTFNTPAWSPQSPLVPFCALTTTPPPPSAGHSQHPTPFSPPCLSAPATAGLSLQLIGTFDLFGSASMLHRGVRVPWLSSPTKDRTYMWKGHRPERECFDGMVKNCLYERLCQIRKGLSPFNF